MIRRFTRDPVLEPKTRSTVRIESIVLPERPIIDHISDESTLSERRIPSSSCFSSISIASILITSDETIRWRKSFGLIRKK
jgi:hypothetical protein